MLAEQTFQESRNPPSPRRRPAGRRTTRRSNVLALDWLPPRGRHPIVLPWENAEKLRCHAATHFTSILSRCQLPQPNCQRTAMCGSESACRQRGRLHNRSLPSAAARAGLGRCRQHLRLPEPASAGNRFSKPLDDFGRIKQIGKGNRRPSHGQAARKNSVSGRAFPGDSPR